MFLGCLGIWSRHKQVAKVSSLLWSIKLYLLSFFLFWSGFFPQLSRENLIYKILGPEFLFKKFRCIFYWGSPNLSVSQNACDISCIWMSHMGQWEEYCRFWAVLISSDQFWWVSAKYRFGWSINIFILEWLEV